jgi:hypothetical protein
MDPARMFLENLTPSPELENGQGHSLRIHTASVRLPPSTQVQKYRCVALSNEMGH